MSKFEVGQVWVNGRGQRVRIVCVDRDHAAYPVVGLLDTGDEELLEGYTSTGAYNINQPDSRDLVALAPKEIVVEGWMNIIQYGKEVPTVLYYHGKDNAGQAVYSVYTKVIARAIPFKWTGVEPG